MNKPTMIMALAMVLTMSHSKGALSAPLLLTPEAACRLAKHDTIPDDISYSIAGRYFWDMHGPVLELPSCDSIIFPDWIGGEGGVVLDKYLKAWKDKCGFTAVGGFGFSGVFTGTFFARSIPGRARPVYNFAIVGVASKDLDVTAITCP